MAPADEDVVVASGARRQRGRRRNLSWGTVFCLGPSRRDRERGDQQALAEETAPWERSRRSKRTVPVDADQLLATTAAGSEAMWRGTGTGTGADDKVSRKVLRLPVPGCCFSGAPGRKDSTMDSSSSGHSKQRHALELTEPPPPPRSQRDKSSLPSPTGGSNGSRCGEAEQRRGGGGPAQWRSHRPATRGGCPGSSREQAAVVYREQLWEAVAFCAVCFLPKSTRQATDALYREQATDVYKEQLWEAVAG